MVLSYTVTVSKDVTEWPTADEPFHGHQYITSTDADGVTLRHVVVRFKRFTSLLKALGYYRAWRRTAKTDERFYATFKVGGVNTIGLELPVPDAVMAPPPSRRAA